MNIKENVAQIQSDISLMKSDIDYIKKMMEEFTLSFSEGDGKQEAMRNMLKKFGGVINKDPNMQKHPDIQSTINDLFKVIS